MIIISNQTLNDVTVATRTNIDYYLIFKDIDEKKLYEIYYKCSLGIPFELFKKLYNDAVSTPFSFFYFSCNKPDFRKNFDEQYTLEKQNFSRKDI